MEDSTILKSYCFWLSLVMLLCVTSVFGEGITFTFANGQVTGTSPKYYEFNVMAAASEPGTRIGDTMVYINYSIAAFGQSIVTNGKITVSKDSLLLGGVDPFWYYTILNIEDNTNSRVAITNEYNYPGSPAFGNALPTTPKELIHVKIEIASESEGTGLSFQESFMVDQQYQSDNLTKYDPVTASDTDDSSLPVQMTSVMATADQEEGITITWQTQSETDCAGFRVWRSESREGPYEQITTSLIPGQGNSSTSCEYTFNDTHVQDGVVYWYKVEEVSTKVESRFYGPVSVMGVRVIPTEFGLSQNYPNPFNPETSFEYQLPEATDVSLRIYSLLGKVVKEWVHKNQSEGYYAVKWNGTDVSGRRVPSGIYLLHMQAGSFSEIRKMTIMR